VRWRHALPRGAATPQRDPERVHYGQPHEHWDAVGLVGDHVLAIGAEGMLTFLDPKTGKPVTHHLLSVTVLHEDPTWADAWDTALLCVGETEAAKIAEAEQLKALLIYQEGQELKEHMSSAFITAQAKRDR